MKIMNMMFLNVAKDEEERYWFFDRKKQFIGYLHDDFKRVYPVKILEKGIKNFWARNLYLQGECIYITSQHSVHVLVYNIHTNSFQSFIGKVFEKGESYNVIRHDNKIIFMPYNMLKDTYIFDVNTHEFHDKKWLCEVDVGIGEVEYIFEKEDFVYLPVVGTNCMICLNLEKFDYEKIYFKKDICLNSVLIEEGGVWITQRFESTIIYSSKAGCEYYEYGEEIEKAFGVLVSVGDKIVALARNAKYFGIVDKCSKEVKHITDKSNIVKRYGGASLFAGYCVVGEKIILFPWAQELLCELDCKTEELQAHALRMGERDYYSILETWDIWEKSERDLSKFVEMVKEFEG